MIDLSYFNPRKKLFVRFNVNGEKNNNSEIGKNPKKYLVGKNMKMTLTHSAITRLEFLNSH